MNNNLLYPLCAITVVTLVTWSLRAAPFVLFGRKPLPETMLYLGRVLPASIMTVLVIYCLRNTSFSSFPFGMPELISCLIVVIFQASRRNMYLSIVSGTLCYMLLIRIM